jgi:hypothetical protein
LLRGAADMRRGFGLGWRCRALLLDVLFDRALLSNT